MNRDEAVMRTIDRIKLHNKAIDILQNPAIPYVQAVAMIEEMFRHYKYEAQDYYESDEDHDKGERSDMQDIIDDDNRERAADMNAVNRSYY